jgi:light-harvesting complex 1 beta chain
MAEERIVKPRQTPPRVVTPQQPETEVNTVSAPAFTPDQAKEFHEQFKVTYSAFVGLAAVAHLLVFASKPWF